MISVKIRLAMAAFAQFASDLDQSTKNLLARGARLTEMLKQPQYQPMAVEEEVVAIFAGVKGFLDKIPVNKVHEFESKALDAIKANHPEFLQEIVKEKKISEELEQKQHINTYKHETLLENRKIILCFKRRNSRK